MRVLLVDDDNSSVEALRQLIDLLSKLRVVMLHGGSARAGWRRFERAYPRLIDERGIRVIATYHTSRQAFRHRDPKVRDARREHLRRAFAEAARLLSE